MTVYDDRYQTTILSDWYASGHLTRVQYDALVNWREDGGGIRRRDSAGAAAARRTPGASSRRSISDQEDPDHMRDNARRRHNRVWNRMQQINDDAARATRRLVMLDDPDIDRVDLVIIGAQIAAAYYTYDCRNV